jgi:hypothetical protein
MEPGLIIGLILLAGIIAGAVINLGFTDRSGALDDDKSGPMPFGESRPKGYDPGTRRHHD